MTYLLTVFNQEPKEWLKIYCNRVYTESIYYAGRYEKECIRSLDYRQQLFLKCLSDEKILIGHNTLKINKDYNDSITDDDYTLDDIKNNMDNITLIEQKGLGHSIDNYDVYFDLSKSISGVAYTIIFYKKFIRNNNKLHVNNLLILITNMCRMRYQIQITEELSQETLNKLIDRFEADYDGKKVSFFRHNTSPLPPISHTRL